MMKLSKVQVPFNHLAEYEKFNPREYKNIIRLSKKLKKKTVIHINATSCGGGVAELLKSQIPLEKSLGIDSHWFCINAPRRFFNITKKIHNLMQGKPGFLNEKEKSYYLEVNNYLGKSLKKICRKFKKGIIMIHDPQPLPLVSSVPKNFLSVLRIHIDLSTPNSTTLDFLRPFIMRCRAIIVSSKDYRKSLPWADKSKIRVIQPAIDPLTPKNRPMDVKTAERVVEQFGINTFNPIMTQVSRLDPWKDPMGVIRAYYIAKNKIPKLQLILVGFFIAKDDPEAKDIFKKIKKHAAGDNDIHLFVNLKKLKNVTNEIFINAVYTVSNVVVQKSIREGFGLTITEAMWKGKPVIAGATEGAETQIKSGKNGILVSSPEEAAKFVVKLIEDKNLGERLGKAAVLSVKRRFLLLRFLLDNLKIYFSLL